jgi:hypothetical protein
MCAVAAVGCVDAGNAADDSTGTVSQKTSGGGGFVCSNKDTIQGVGCVGSIAVLPINVDVHDVGNLDNNQLNVLSGDLNNVAILDGGILNNNTILNDVYAAVLNDFLNKFLINVSGNDVNVCTTVLGVLLCKS